MRTKTSPLHDTADYSGPCYEVSKLRAVRASGELWFDRWCYKHHHWLNDAPPQRTATDEILEGVLGECDAHAK